MLFIGGKQVREGWESWSSSENSTLSEREMMEVHEDHSLQACEDHSL